MITLRDMANDENKDAGYKEGDDAGPDVELFETWVQKHYGENSRTKTITSEKYLRIRQLIRGEDSNTNAKFRFWVRSKGFRLISHDKNTDEVTDDPCGSLFVSLHAKEDNTPMGEQSIEKFLRTNLPAISFFRKVAMVEEFYGIIKCAHVDDNGVHAGQKKTYRLVSDTYAFLPREVITFYLLNCNTCKPRIQKYGPIHSKVRMNNLPSPKINSEKSSVKTPNEPEIYTRENPNSNQVIRPSPKRYRPTYIAEVFPESYSNSKMYESQLKPKNVNDAPAVHIRDDKSKRYKTEKIVYHSHMMQTKGSELPVFRGPWPSRSNEQGYFPSHAVSDTANRGLKATSPSEAFSIRASDIQKEQEARMISKERKDYSDIERMGINNGKDDTKKFNYEPKIIPRSSSEFVICSSSCCSHLNSSLEYFENKKERSERFYGCRMQPYKLFQRNDNIRNYQEHILEPDHNKDMLSQPCLPYFSENKDRYMNLYGGNKSSGKIDFPSSSSIWRKAFIAADIADSTVESWKRTVEKTQLDYSNRGTCQQHSN